MNSEVMVNDNFEDFAIGKYEYDQYQLGFNYELAANKTANPPESSVDQMDQGDLILKDKPTNSHCGKKVINVRSSKKVINVIQDADTVLYKCDLCTYQTKSKYSVQAHFKDIHSPETVILNCHHCSYQTRRKGDLGRHIRINHNPDAVIYKCDHCKFQTKEMCKLRDHSKTVHSPDAEIYECVYCKYQTKWKQTLKGHIRIMHGSDARIFKCTHCDYQTKWRRSLSQHLTTHDWDAEVFECPYCKIQSKWKGNLTKHIKMKHSSEIVTLNRVDPEHQINRKVNLPAPLESEDGEVQKCDRCEFQTKWKGNLKEHIKKKHTSVLHR